MCDKCEICGKPHTPDIIYDNNYRIRELLRVHEDCMRATKNIVNIKSQIRDLEKKLCDEEYNLFVLKNNVRR